MFPRHYIKNKNQKQDYQCCFCFEINNELLKCTGGCEKKYCQDCIKQKFRSRSCSYCHSSFQPIYLPIMEFQYFCPSLNQKCTAQLRTEQQFYSHSSTCQYIPQETRIQFQFKLSYKCPKGHPLDFPLNKLNCDSCGKFHYTGKCSTCNLNLCTECVKVPCSKEKCPMGHDLRKGRDSGFITCDLCAISLRLIMNTTVYSDRQCNFDICEHCYNKIPEESPYGEKWRQARQQ